VGENGSSLKKEDRIPAMKFINRNDKILDYATLKEEKSILSDAKSSNEFDIHNSLGLIGRFPHQYPNLKDTKKANRYLAYQENRINKKIEEGKIKEAVLIWIMLLKISKSYQILLFHRVVKSWYWE